MMTLGPFEAYLSSYDQDCTAKLVFSVRGHFSPLRLKGHIHAVNTYLKGKMAFRLDGGMASIRAFQRCVRLNFNHVLTDN